jgi:hypothetical protein
VRCRPRTACRRRCAAGACLLHTGLRATRSRGKMRW